MDKQQYLDLRNGLYAEAEAFINEGKVEDANKKMEEITNLDNKFETEAKAQANLNAFKNNAKVIDITNKGCGPVAGIVIDSMSNVNDELLNDSKEKREPKEYVNAWAKDMLGMQMSNSEKEAFNFVNEYTHTTANTGVVIPETVMTGIWKEVGEQYPLWNDVFKTFIKGKITLLKADTSSEAGWYEEGQTTEDGKETFAEISLNGCELSRSITISWKLKEMAIDDFITYVQSQLVEKMGKALGYGVALGKGQPGESDTFKAEPKGIIPTLLGEASTPQVITFTDADELSYKKMTKAMSLIKGSYKNGAVVYANGTTIWNEIANITDATGRPYFVANPIAGGVGTIFGKTVKEDDSIPDNNILIGDAKNGYHANVNKQVSLDSEDHKKERETDYIAYGIVDGGVRSNKAFALIKKA